MKKILVLLSLILFITGCNIIKIDDESVDTIIDTVLKKENKLYNEVFEGYKYYLPKGMQLRNKTDYNAQITYLNYIYYLYVDVISYYHNVKEDYEENQESFYSRALDYNGKTGYLEVNKVEDRYFIEMMYHYAKMEAYVPEEQLQEALIQISNILSSVQFNDKVLGTLIGENVLNYKEETFNIFKPKRENGNFLDYVKEFGVYHGEDGLPDEDHIEAENTG